MTTDEVALAGARSLVRGITQVHHCAVMRLWQLRLMVPANAWAAAMCWWVGDREESQLVGLVFFVLGALGVGSMVHSIREIAGAKRDVARHARALAGAREMVNRIEARVKQKGESLC